MKSNELYLPPYHLIGRSLSGGVGLFGVVGETVSFRFVLADLPFLGLSETGRGAAYRCLLCAYCLDSLAIFFRS